MNCSQPVVSHLDCGTLQGRRYRSRAEQSGDRRVWCSGAGGPRPLAGGRRNSTRPSSTQQPPPPPRPDGTCSLLALPLRPFVVCSWACEDRSIRKPRGHSIPIPSHLAGRRSRPQNILPHRVSDSALSCSLWCPSRLREGALLAPSVPAPGKPHTPLESNWSGPAGISDARLDWADG